MKFAGYTLDSHWTIDDGLEALYKEGQLLKYKDIKTCYAKAIEDGITATDDTALAELLNLDVYLTKGLYSNLKITTPEDIAIASEIIRSRGESEPFTD